MKNKYGIKVGDIIKTSQDVYHGMPDYGDVVVLELLPKSKALIKFTNTGNIKEARLFDLNRKRVTDVEVYEKHLKQKIEPTFNEIVENIWEGWNPYSDINGAKYVPILGSEKGSNFLTKIVGKTLIDDWFYEKYWGIALTNSGTGYVNISPKKDNIEKFFGIRLNSKIKPIKLHHFVKGHINFKNYVVDHVNGDVTDNRFCNLRTATATENGRNSRKSISANKHSKYKGIFYDKKRDYVGKTGKQRKCWKATVTVGNKSHTEWCYSEKEAAMAYNKLAVKYQGEFARLNEIT